MPVAELLVRGLQQQQHLSNASLVTGTATCRQYRGPRPLGARRGQQGRRKGLEGTGELRLRARVIGRWGSHHVSARLGAEIKSMGMEWDADADPTATAEEGAACATGLSQHHEVILCGSGGQALFCLVLPLPNLAPPDDQIRAGNDFDPRDCESLSQILVIRPFVQRYFFRFTDTQRRTAPQHVE